MALIETDVNGVPIEAAIAGLKPVYFNEQTRPSPDVNYHELIYISRQCWTYLGFTGLMTPWHDQDDPFKFLKIQREKFRKFFFEVKNLDIDWKTYCFLLYISSTYDKWERPTLLTMQQPAKSWFKKLRKHAGSSDMVDHVCEFMQEFISLQIETSGKATFSPSIWLDTDPNSVLEVQRANKKRAQRVASGQKVRAQKRVKKPTKYYSIFHRIVDRINFLNSRDLHYKDWLRMKFRRCVEQGSLDHVSLAVIVNVNAFDPDVKEAQTRFKDPWREVKEFLGLSLDCKFPDNCIPKGWRPASEDTDDIKKIAVVKGDGYYYYTDGSQRRGKRHYATNKYLVISCIPDNFDQFKSTWDDPRRISGRPTWEEYLNWGLYPDLWTAEGVSQYHGIQDVTWRVG
jgi:hypothetical protein